MGQRLQFLRPELAWRGGHGERLWLAALVEAMEDVAQPARRGKPCDDRTIAAFRAQFALPAQPRLASPFSLRN